MDPDDILLETEEAMDKAFEYMTHEFSAVRTGKASPALVENIDVEAYGTPMKLRQLGSTSPPGPRMLVVNPFEGPTTKETKKAIKKPKPAITPTPDGKISPLPIPPLTEERRKDLV